MFPSTGRTFSFEYVSIDMDPDTVGFDARDLATVPAFGSVALVALVVSTSVSALLLLADETFASAMSFSQHLYCSRTS